VIDHVDYIVNLVGDDHVAIGTDYGTPTTSAERDQLVKSGVWRASNYPPLPWHYPRDFEDASKFPNLASRLAERGYTQASVEKVLGLNFLRVYSAVCGL
jgi:membrane dipeptidase